jgi:hypothetical protein
MSYALKGPDNWFQLSEDERHRRTRWDDDLCVIDESQYYVRGCLETPVLGTTETLIFGVWISVSEASFRRILDLWDVPDVADEPPRFAWLCNWLRGYPEPIGIKCHVHIRLGNLRPAIELEPTDYPLAVEQRHGVTLDRVKEIAALSGHPPDANGAAASP